MVYPHKMAAYWNLIFNINNKIYENEDYEIN
jgi:hypothetical protein